MASKVATMTPPTTFEPLDNGKVTSLSVPFQPAKHMAFEPPKSVITLKELLLSEENACSPVAITEPFPLFSLSGVIEIRRDVFRKEVVLAHGQKIKPGIYKMRGYSKDTPFVDAVWRSPEVIAACSQAAGVELEVMFDYEIGHVNVQLDELVDKESLDDILPPPVPPKTPVAISTDTQVEENQQQLSSVRDWHIDAYPWVCVVMLSDPEGMKGGETGIEKGDGSILKMLGPGIGWAVMMQGGSINHIALKAFGAKERITMVTSFRAKDPLAKDMSTLHITNKSSRLEELFPQWTSYRMETIARRADAVKAQILKEDLSPEEIKALMKAWVKEQTEYLEVTCREMEGAIPYGTNKNVH